MVNQDVFSVNVDLVLCIDATGSMGPIIDEVKTNALSFHDRMTVALEEKGRNVEQLRVRVIVFRDYYCDGDNAMCESRFFKLPQENADFRRFVDEINATGGGDEPENALESLYLAMKSDWIKDGVRKRHVIVLFTDASAHPLEKAMEGEKPSNYPVDMPANLSDLSAVWDDPQGGAMDARAKRLVLFTPEAYPWSTLATGWRETVQVQSKAGAGMDEIDMESVLATIANSI